MTEQIHKYGDIRADGRVFQWYRKLPSGNIIEQWRDPIGFALDHERRRFRRRSVGRRGQPFDRQAAKVRLFGSDVRS